MRIQLRWDDPVIGERREPILELPIALGREFAQMPASLRDRRVSRMVLNSEQVSRFHALIDHENGELIVVDQNSRNGVWINGVRQSRASLANGDAVQIGPYVISFILLSDVEAGAASPSEEPPSHSTIRFHPDTDIPTPILQPASPDSAEPSPAGTSRFPPPAFESQQVSVQALHATGLVVDEIDYCALGAGLGSFFWVDLLRLAGIKSDQIMALGLESAPYARYQRLCRNSQIPLHERLRSNSDSCPDNIWGWPSYAWREAARDLARGRVGSAIHCLWSVFAEPDLAQTYTPRAGNVFRSIDREANRIGWGQMFRYGRIRAIRKTDDGRYAIAYSRSTASRRDHAFLIARYVHLAPGYPAIQFLPDLQTYREQTGDFKSVVNAYEDHEHVYEHLQQHGGTVMLRGRGIVASRIMQRLYEVRQQNPNIAVLHLMRSPKPQGNKFGTAQRQVENHYEFQPFNWPKSCWGGELRAMLEAASPDQRQRLLAEWGGTTTAKRRDWQRIVQTGLEQGWYRITFGEVERVEQDPDTHTTTTTIREKSLKGKIALQADFVIDATGLDTQVTVNPLLGDLVSHYDLPLNPLGRLSVANSFELREMRTDRGRFYAAGAITLGGPHAAVDSFLGLQYAALCAVDDLRAARTPKIRSLNTIRSFWQWLKWAFNRSPC